MAAVTSSRWMLHIGGCWGDSPFYVKRFECIEKRYINVSNYYYKLLQQILPLNSFFFCFCFCMPFHSLFHHKPNQIKSLLLSHHHSTSALVSEILMSVLQTVQKNNRQFTYGQTVQKKKKNHLHMDRQCKKQQQTIYIWTDSAKKQQTIYIWTDSAKKQQTIYIWTDSAKKLHWSIYSAPDSAKKKNNSNLHMDRQCKKTTSIYIWTVHIYRLYRRQCAKYTYIYSVHIVYYKDILNYQRHIIHRMGTSTLCTVSIHNVVYT